MTCLVRLWFINEAFSYIHDIGDTSQTMSTCFPPYQRNVCALPWNICSAETNECVVEYIGIYSAVNDLSMLAASRGRPVTQQPTSKLVHHLILCMVVIVKLKEVRKVSDFHMQANLETPPHRRQFYEAQRRHLRSL